MTEDDISFKIGSKLEGIEMKIQSLRDEQQRLRDIREQLEYIEEDSRVVSHSEPNKMFKARIETESISEELEILMGLPGVEAHVTKDPAESKFKCDIIYHQGDF